MDALIALVTFFAFFALSSLCTVIADYLAEIHRVTVAVCYNKFAESIYFAACNAYAVGAVRTVFTVDTCVAFFTLDALVALVAFFALYALVTLVTFFALNALVSLCAVVADYLAEIYRVTVAVCYNKLTESIYFAACNAYAVNAVRAVFTVCTAKACVALFAFFTLDALVALCALYVSEIK